MLVRDKSKIYLIGHVFHQITGCKLPSNRQVLKCLFYNMRKVGLSLKEAANLTLTEVLVFWEKARIPIQLQKHAVIKVEKLYNEWRSLQKNAARKTKSQEEKVLAFTSKLDDLFDVAKEDALSKMTNPEDILFLTSQRQKGRPGHMGGIDLKTTQLEERREARKARAQELRKTAPKKVDEEKTVDLPSNSESEEEPMDLDSDFPQESTVEGDDIEECLPSRRSRQVVTEKLAMFLDRCNISDRNAVRIIFAIAEVLVDTEDLVLSRSTVRNRRLFFRNERTKKIKDRFKKSELEGSIVHWDGKLLPNLLQKENVERLAILVSNGGEEQLLGVPALPNSMGATQSEAICECLEEWGVSQKIVGMCFDTTASNTGRVKGACTLVEKELGRNLLYLACRHHILEVVLRAVFDCKMGSTTGPQPDIFKKFQIYWPKIDQSKYKEGVQEETVKNMVKDCEDELSKFLFSQLKERHPRDDYRELIKLCLIFLGKVPSHEVTFRAPGAFHHARWMAKAIYILKIFIFREQFSLTDKEYNAARDICLFVVKLYVKMWFLAPNPVQAPNEDLKFIQDVIAYKKIDQSISEKALGKYLNHLWYLNPEQVCFALFDKNVSRDVKEKMAKKILSHKNIDEDERSERTVRVQVPKNEAEELFKKISLDHFISDQSLELFERFKITTNFLTEDPENWPENEEYLKCFGLITLLKVVNDTAERGVKLIQDFNNSLTKDEEQKQYLLQVVAECRRLHPDTSKSTLAKQFPD